MSSGNSQEVDGKRKLFFDVTKQLKHGHYSGLNRVSARLLAELRKSGEVLPKPVKWSTLRRSFVEPETNRAVGTGEASDIFFTPEVFELSERPFMRGWMRKFKGLAGCMFHDAIPHFFPSITWPKSVRRFPGLLKGLCEFDRVFYVSRRSRDDAMKAGVDLGVTVPHGQLITLGCDYQGLKPKRQRDDELIFLQVGIIEPRKGQVHLIEACELLWQEGFSFKLVLLGRVNPHFGKDCVARIKRLQESGRDLVFSSTADDNLLSKWHGRASLQVSPSFTEGFGLPVIEALWAGVPVLASRQPVMEVLSGTGGVECIENITTEEIYTRLKKIFEDPGYLKSAAREIKTESLPTWENTVNHLLRAFK